MDNPKIGYIDLIPSFSQVSAICETYGIGSLVSIIRVFEATANMNMLILTQKGKYVVKIFTCEPERFDFVVNVLHSLKRNKVPVLVPLKNRKGKYYLQSDTKLIQLTKFISGCPYQYSEIQSLHSGRMLRKFHDSLSKIVDVVKPVASLYPSDDILVEAVNHLTEIQNMLPGYQIDTVLDLFNEIVEEWDKNKSLLPQTIIHGDWNQNNQSFHTSGAVCCIMDFDFITRAERLFDVAYFLWRIELSNESKDASKAFLQGYGPLLDVEIQYLPFEISRIGYYYLCSSSMSIRTGKKLASHLKSHYPLVSKYLSEEGQNHIRSLCIKY